MDPVAPLAYPTTNRKGLQTQAFSVYRGDWIRTSDRSAPSPLMGVSLGYEFAYLQRFLVCALPWFSLKLDPKLDPVVDGSKTHVSGVSMGDRCPA